MNEKERSKKQKQKEKERDKVIPMHNGISASDRQ